jgi:hypothetical protein
MSAVLTRKSHHKSRNGCRGCKQRHVKACWTYPYAIYLLVHSYSNVSVTRLDRGARIAQSGAYHVSTETVPRCTSHPQILAARHRSRAWPSRSHRASFWSSS